MNIKVHPGVPNEVDYLFFSASFKHKEVFYKIAVAECISYESEFTGHYKVLQTSQEGTISYNIYPDENAIWVCENHLAVQQEVVYLIGQAIENIRE